MKHLVLLVSALSLFSLNAHSSEQAKSPCKKDTESTACQAYISGIVEAYIASKQNYLVKQSSTDSSIVDRAYANRVGYHRAKAPKAQRACLPDDIDTEEITKQFQTLNASTDITIALGDYLRNTYPCK